MDKNCLKCRIPHNKPGTHCSRSCANKKQWSAETNAKRSKSSKETYSNRSVEDIKKHVFTTQSTRYNTLRNRDFDTLSYHAKRRRVFLEQDCKCAICKLDEWMSGRLRLELDHVDGNNQNNTRENMRGICPNCHSQTPTWRGKTTEVKWKEIERLLEYKKHQLSK